MNIERPRGTRDFTPDQMRKRRTAEEKLRMVAERWGYGEIRTPTFEHLELFTVKSGSEIIEEIYAFEDKGGRELALRPELTAPVMRFYVNDLMAEPKPLRFYYYGNCFRYERPQKGRFREFWQFGTEIIGSDTPAAEAETIALATTMINTLGIDADLHVGHLGVTRGYLDSLDLTGEEEQVVMRLMDKREYEELRTTLGEKGEDIIGLINARTIGEAREIAGDSEHLDSLERIFGILDTYGIRPTLNLSIVRGLEYYTGMVFEAFAEGLGAQNQICGGGSYRLAHLFGGEDTPSTGFGLGFDRIMEIYEPPTTGEQRVVVVATDDARDYGIKVAQRIRGVRPAEIDIMGRGVGSQLKRADSIEAKWAVIVGEREKEAGTATLRDMQSGEQEEMGLDELVERLQE